jgi:hypothetical protein
MAESKSAAILLIINEYSELSRSVLSLRTLDNLPGSERPSPVIECDDGMFRQGWGDCAPVHRPFSRAGSLAQPAA